MSDSAGIDIDDTIDDLAKDCGETYEVKVNVHLVSGLIISLCNNCAQSYFNNLGTITIAEMVGAEKVSLSRQKQTFWHELVHSILSTMRKEELNNDESFVNTFASFLHEAVDTMQ